MILEKLKFSTDFASVPHKRELNKPNEDRLLIDEENGIFIILDGVTRVHKEYDSSPFASAAGDVGDIFLKEAHEYIKAHIKDSDPKAVLYGAADTANTKIKKYRKIKSQEEWEFYPATLGIISILRDNTLHYISVGDCLGVLLRHNSKILFGRELSLEAVDLNKVNKTARYMYYCNQPGNELSYTVFNGDDAVIEGLEYSFIDIHPDDCVILASDGIGNYLKYEKAADIIFQSAEEIISLSEKYDIPPYAEYADDKSLIKISF